MTKTLKIAMLALCLAVSAFTQEKPGEGPTGTVELLSPWLVEDQKTAYNPVNSPKSCFDLIRLTRTCGGPQSLAYGDRSGINLDLFKIAGPSDSQTRMIDVGKYDWSDKISLPTVEPWSKLGLGEVRYVTVDVSGADGRPGSRGADGPPGMNGDGTYSPARPSAPAAPIKAPEEGMADKSIDRQVTSTITMNGKPARGDKYTPYNEVKKGHMYLAHVVDPKNDHYVLIRVDDLVRGEKVTISFLRINAEKAVF